MACKVELEFEVKVTLEPELELKVSRFTLLILPSVEPLPAEIDRLWPPPFIVEVGSMLNKPDIMKLVSLGMVIIPKLPIDMFAEVMLELAIGLFALALMKIFAVVPGTVPPTQLEGVDQLVEVAPLHTE